MLNTDRNLMVKLVTDFDSKKRSSELSHFSEEDIKQHFISPFWASLGWNMHDSLLITHLMKCQCDIIQKRGAIWIFGSEKKS